MTRSSGAPLPARAGFTLAELLGALTLTALIGTVVTSIFVSHDRSFERLPRSSAGDAAVMLEAVLAEVRRVERDFGVAAASDSSVALRVPFASGIVCAASRDSLTALLLPAAAADAWGPGFRGYMFRPLSEAGAGGRYHYVSSSPGQMAPGDAAACRARGIEPDSISGHRVVTIRPGAAAARAGYPLMLYGDVLYRFTQSGEEGRSALVRHAADGRPRVLLTSLPATARFRFHHGALTGAAHEEPPERLSDLDGIELVLAGSRDTSAAGLRTGLPLRASVFFQNRRD